ncbi:UNKNOWN [Stylonychia lemnae]|uniref:DNA polymerase delta subunit 3 n=1 Tax=Stylonychia lemnae TaxID=5949 RepID=A0A077ZPP4_STYLE|nr:UNKNOWN [Stylonychia lemnae]|eukprot:CDW71434.1 UNKNOWN [Stylonychia lemnae]
MQTNSANQSSLNQIEQMLHSQMVTIYDLMARMSIDQTQAKQLMMNYAFKSSKKSNLQLKKLFMIERLSVEHQDQLEFKLVYEHELQNIIKSGQVLQNAYIYALFNESFDIDRELFNNKRLGDSFNTFNQVFTFDHSNNVIHQNAINRKKLGGKPGQSGKEELKTQPKPLNGNNMPANKQQATTTTNNAGANKPANNPFARPNNQPANKPQQQTLMASNKQTVIQEQQKIHLVDERKQNQATQNQSSIMTNKPIMKGDEPMRSQSPVKNQPTVQAKAFPTKMQEVVHIKDDEMIDEHMSGEKPASKNRRSGGSDLQKSQNQSNQANGLLKKDESQDSIIKKLQSNKIFDSDEEGDKKKQGSGGKRLKKTQDIDMNNEEEEQGIRRDRKTNQKKRTINLDDEEDDRNNEMDVQSMSSMKENTNISNMVKQKMGATVVQPSQNEKPNGDIPSNTTGIAKGRRKVIKQRQFYDKNGYVNYEDYSSFEEYDLPPPKSQPAKQIQKTVLNLTGQGQPAQTQNAPVSKAKGQSSLAAFFTKK